MTIQHDKLMQIAQKYIGTHRDDFGNKRIAGWLANVGCDPMTDGEPTPYCAAFIHGCLKEAGIDTEVFKSASVIEMWNKTPVELRVPKAYKGCIFVWRFANGSGHAGLCLNALPDDRMDTVEGNTRNSADHNSTNERDGGWVMEKNRTNLITTVGGIEILGFIDPYL